MKRKHVTLSKLGLRVSRTPPPGIALGFWRRHIHALIATERAVGRAYEAVEVGLRARL